ncbi:MAG: GlsB/YeaQ/YmgE family stress response membrane protein [Deltaproteobacteria bacterium]|nr:GlsB/YeaQ/YmgE family stress response membrane protein [Deltaproteobacteria bacterium]
MTLVGLIVLLVVAFVVGALGELIGGVKVPGGILGSIVVGFIGAWIGGALFHFGPVVGGIQVVPAIIGGAIFAFALRLILKATRRRTVA